MHGSKPLGQQRAKARHEWRGQRTLVLHDIGERAAGNVVHSQPRLLGEGVRLNETGHTALPEIVRAIVASRSNRARVCGSVRSGRITFTATGSPATE